MDTALGIPPLTPLASLLRQQTVQGMVHDMKAPMTVLKGYLQLLLSGVMGSMPAEQKKVLEQTVGPLEELIQMADNLLQAATLEERLPTLSPVVTNLDTFLQQIVEFYQLPFEQRHMKISRKGEARGMFHVIDAFWVKRALHNLIWNAYKFTPDGGEVSLEVRRMGRDLEIIVADTGRGISAEQLPHIFEKFGQVCPETDRKMGSGLGLWICRQVMELHGGTIRVESTPGQGTQFFLHFPG